MKDGCWGKLQCLTPTLMALQVKILQGLSVSEEPTKVLIIEQISIWNLLSTHIPMLDYNCASEVGTLCPLSSFSSCDTGEPLAVQWKWKRSRGEAVQELALSCSLSHMWEGPMGWRFGVLILCWTKPCITWLWPKDNWITGSYDRDWQLPIHSLLPTL